MQQHKYPGPFPLTSSNFSVPDSQRFIPAPHGCIISHGFPASENRKPEQIFTGKVREGKIPRVLDRMKHSELHHINGAGRYRQRRQRELIVVLCLIISIVCIISLAILIKTNLDRSGASAATSATTAPAETTPAPTAAASIAIDPNATSATQPSAAQTTGDPSAAATASGTSASAQTISADARAKALTDLSSAVSDLLDKESGRYSVYYVNLTTGETLGYKESAPMVAASSIKIAYNTYLYQQAAAGAFSMSDEMTYNAKPYPEGDLETGTGTIQTSADGTKYTVSELSHLSITISDNCATNMILRELGGIDAVNDGYMVPISAIVNYRTPVSYTDYNGAEQSGKHRTSAEDLALYAKNLYVLYKANPDIYQPLMDDLKTTEYNWGLPAGVPSGTAVAHKVGFNPAYGANNDVGIVFAQEDYVLCVMTESGSDSNAQTVIGNVSKLFSDYITSCYA